MPDRNLLHLARTFPTLNHLSAAHFDGPRFKDAAGFAESMRSGGGGQIDAALFVLSVWNHNTDWTKHGLVRDDGPNGGRFDVHRAIGNWDLGHREAFLDWAADPWWC